MKDKPQGNDGISKAFKHAEMSSLVSVGAALASLVVGFARLYADGEAVDRLLNNGWLISAVSTVVLATVGLTALFTLGKLGRTRRLSEEVTGAYREALLSSFLNPSTAAKTRG